MRALVYTRPTSNEGLTKTELNESVREIEKLIVDKIGAGDNLVEEGKVLIEIQAESLSVA